MDSKVSLSQDIFDSAIDLLQDDHRALGTCALVCRDWAHRSRVHLFSQVVIPYSGRLVDYSAKIREEPEGPMSRIGEADDRARELRSLLDRNSRLADYIRAVEVRAVRKSDEAEMIRWTPSVLSHLRLAHLSHLRSLRLVNFAFASFADIIPTIQAMPVLETLKCEDVQFLPWSSSPREPVDAGVPSEPKASPVARVLDLTGTLASRNLSLKTVSLSVAINFAAELEHPDTAAPARALHSAQAFMHSAGLLSSVTSLEVFDARTVLGWLPIIKAIGPQLHHVGVALHDVSVGDEELESLHQYNTFPAERETVNSVYDALQTCTSLCTLSIRYEAEDTTSVRMVHMGMPSTPDEGPPISSYFFDEAVRLFSGAYDSDSLNGTSSATVGPFPALQKIELHLITTAHSLRNCGHAACTALAGVLTGPDYPEFARLFVEIEEPEMLGVLWGDREAGEAACVRKAAAVRSGMFRGFEQAGIALDVSVRQRPAS